ncbi:hypothetical protein QCA50_016666 [Cerrena zonata]|uniref:CCHC-type domain-containing protein n=1 Tax=Cerrena zonata TaxID=2478898 RepID=A0AAW0FS83_9APHY
MKKAQNDNKIAPSTQRPASRLGNQKNDQEVEEIIGKLNHMSLEDPAYAINYFRAYQLNPIIADIVRKPIKCVRTPRPPSHFIPPGSEQGGRPNPGPTGANAYQQGPGFGLRHCFGCGADGHTMAYCSAINDLVKQGIIKRDGFGKLVMADGSRIYRMHDESFAAAVKHTLPVQTNFITTQNFHNQEHLLDPYECDFLSGNESDTGNEEIYIATQSQYNKDKQKDYQGVFPPATKQHETKHP